MIALGHERATLVGHSLGGGVALQFTYQFPEMVERLVLVSSGGLGPEVGAILRAAALPGADIFIRATAGPGATAGGLADRRARQGRAAPERRSGRGRARLRLARRRRPPQGLPLDPPRGRRHRGPARRRPRPPLPRRGPAGPDRLGRARPDHPGRPRPRRPRPAPRQPPRGLPRRRPRPDAGEPRPLRRRPPALPRGHRARRIRRRPMARPLHRKKPRMRPAGFEPVASSSGGKRSIQLSYGRSRISLVVSDLRLTRTYVLSAGSNARWLRHERKCSGGGRPDAW